MSSLEKILLRENLNAICSYPTEAGREDRAKLFHMMTGQKARDRNEKKGKL